jgi:hypothetical protein
MVAVSETTLLAIWLAIGACLLAVSATHLFRRTEGLVRLWAQRNDLELVSMEPRFLQQRAFFWISTFQVVYQVTVRSPDGRIRKGWVRASAISDRVTVRWDQA